jgi:hypothetical protein
MVAGPLSPGEQAPAARHIRGVAGGSRIARVRGRAPLSLSRHPRPAAPPRVTPASRRDAVGPDQRPRRARRSRYDGSHVHARRRIRGRSRLREARLVSRKGSDCHTMLVQCDVRIRCGRWVRHTPPELATTSARSPSTSEIGPYNHHSDPLPRSASRFCDTGVTQDSGSHAGTPGPRRCSRPLSTKWGTSRPACSAAPRTSPSSPG